MTDIDATAAALAAAYEPDEPTVNRHDIAAAERLQTWLAEQRVRARVEFASELTRMGVHSLDIHQIRKLARSGQ